MAKTDLQLPGGDYALVADRITLFYERFPDGRIITELVSRSEREVTFRALVFRTAAEREPAATGWASEREGDGDINTVACLENTETSAIGRALANLGFTASAQRPSAEEIAKAARVRSRLGAGGGGQDSGSSQARPAASVTRPPLRVSEAAPPASASSAPPLPVAVDPHLLADLRLLLAAAERAGLRPARAQAVHRLLAARPPSVLRLEAAERWLRLWLSRRPAPGAAADPAPAARPAGASASAQNSVSMDARPDTDAKSSTGGAPDGPTS
ncbi:MAG TPA: hypothetical protein VFS08_16920 [Gemmatimonadaceae bacterium]|nr:hypothetical protein [Gemmatimonadaceae bacterium]